MKKDKEGFLYPKVDESLCIGCGLCEKNCPVVKPLNETLPSECFAAVSKNDEIRKNSSSGGVFSELAEFVIRKGGVVFGAAFNKRFLVSHIMVSNLEDLKQLRGSKYLQSDTGNTFALCKEFLESGVSVLYSGTPCQISGLKHFLKKEYSNLLLVDVICHGVPSPDVWKRYLEEKINSNDRVTSITFRDKTDGWRRYKLAISQKGTVTYLSPVYNNVYMQLFLQNIILRPSCYECPAKAGRSGSDITIADFWGIENVVPKMDDDKGTSLIMVNTKQGLDFLNCIKSHLELVTVSHTDAIRNNSSWSKSVAINQKRKKFFRYYRLWLSFEKGANAILKEKPFSIKGVKKKILSFVKSLLRDK